MQETIDKYIAEHEERFIEELLDLLRIPSISADPAYAEDVQRTAQAVMQSLRAAGATSAALHETPGHPIVTATFPEVPGAPTVLVYGHYDVQPPDPLDLWESPPFEPIIKKTDAHPQGAIFARGSCDDKGQLYMHVKALEAMVNNGGVPCNVKVIVEGEEEVGSSNLEAFLQMHQEELACDVVLVSDSAMIANDVPSISYGLRGLSYVEVEVTGPNRDLHSGVYGGAVANPINVLANMIASLQDQEGRITIPGFYDKVVDLEEKERKALNSIPFDLEEYQKDLGIASVQGEKGYSTIERASTRPTLDVNGIWGGYIGEGAKTVLPSKAYAKISMRLVPNQDPDEITALFAAHFKKIAPPSVQVVVSPHHGGRPAVTPIDSVEYAAAERAMEATFGKTPLPVRGGGSIPIVSLFEQVLDASTVLMGFGLDSDDIHSPNEHFGLFNFIQGIRTIPLFYHFYSSMK
ncbi:MAG: dipeptidase [Saprospiraceae bacterium]|nr:dipeptidase [Saprospiraceae bacterium]